MIVEDKILEYLDGSLSDRESAELLETLSLSPEKRALLEEHLRLKDLLALGKKPFTVPIETERSLAEQIPALGRYNSDLLPIRWPVVRRWIGARTIGVAIGAGAMIVLGGLGWYSMHGTNKSGAENASASRSTVSQSSSSIASGAASQGPGVASQEFSSTISDIPARTLSRGMHSGAINSREQRSNHRTFEVMKSPTAPEPQIVEQNHEAIGSAVPVTSLRESDIAIPGGWMPHTLSELRLGEPKGNSPITTGASLILDEVLAPTVANGPSGALTKPVGDVTIDYDLSESFAIGLDLGEGVSSSLTNSTYILNPSSNYTRLFESPVVTNQTIYNLLLTAHLTLFPEREYQIRIGAAGGDAFGAGPMVEATAGISRVLAPNLILDLSAIGSRIWSKGNSAFTSTTANGVVGIAGQQLGSQSLYTNAFGFRAGLRVRL